MNARADEIIVVGFAGGGGSSQGIRRALGRDPDIGINHDPEAVAMHEANHPGTEHHCQNIWRADPSDVVRGRRVGLAWFSPDCRHFSKAKGGKPVKRNIRDLAWVVVLWARRARPRVIIVENVEEFQGWGPIDMDGIPCPDRKGETFKRWVSSLRRLGYRVEWKELRACDYGSPTIRKRLFLIARCDGAPITWPDPTHGPGRVPYRTAAEIIDWSLPCPSIFLSKEEGRAAGVRRPLAENTLRRIANGVQRYVLEAEEPFFVTYAQHGGRSRSGGAPLHTIAASRKDQNCVVVPTLVHTAHGQADKSGKRRGAGVHDIAGPLGTLTATRSHAVVAAFLAQHNTGVVGHDVRKPVSTVTIKGSQQQVVTSHLINLKGTSRRDSAITSPLPTVTAGGYHMGEVRAFLMKYYGTDQDPRIEEPLHTVTTKDRFGLVTVEIAGESYVIADIGMRMLTPRELFRAQGCDDGFIIDIEVDGKPITKTAQIRMAGNMVCPDPAEALVRANMAGARMEVAA